MQRPQRSPGLRHGLWMASPTSKAFGVTPRSAPWNVPKNLRESNFSRRQKRPHTNRRCSPWASRDKPPAAGAVGTYNDFWWDADARRALNFRTSLIVDPADGKIPPLTPEAQRRVRADQAYAREHPADGPEDRALMERCLLFPTTGPPMLPSFYNNSQFGALTTNYQVVQTRDYVTIFVERNHESRIIPLDGRPHLPSNVHQWLGDSRGHWEGDSLGGRHHEFHWQDQVPRQPTRNLHLIERFTKERSGDTAIRIHHG